MANIDTYIRNIENLNKQISKLKSEKGKENKKILDAKNKIQQTKSSIERTKNQSMINRKLTDIVRYEKTILNASKRSDSIDNKILQKEKDLSKAQKHLDDEQKKANVKREKDDKRMRGNTEKHFESIESSVHNVEIQQQQIRTEIETLKTLPKKITVLFLASNPMDTDNPLRLDAEARAIEEMIRKSDYRDTITFVTKWAVRTSDLLQAINEVNPDVIHFSGHGTTGGDLVFENVNGEHKLVSKETMATVISTLSDKIRFMFFNACFSTEQAKNIVNIVDAAIGMNTSIGDEAAKIFAAQFYSSIGFGRSIDTAFKQAKSALVLEGISEDSIPELYVGDNVNPAEMFLVDSEK